MKSIKKINVLHIFLIFALVVGLLSTSILFACNMIEKYSRVESAISNPNQDIFDGGGGGGGSGGTTADVTINTLLQLTEFINNCNNGNTYAGKTIKLAASINLNGATIGIHSFAGTFDGNGYTLSNLKTNGQYEKIVTGKQGVKNGFYAVGLFGELTGYAVVKDLRLNNVSTYMGSFSKVTAFTISCGGIAGYVNSSAKIERCAVENYDVKIDDYPWGGGFYVSGIFGAGEGQASNCYVFNITAKGINDGVQTIISGIGPGRTTAIIQQAKSLESTNAKMTNCVVRDGEYTYDFSCVEEVINCKSTSASVLGLDHSEIGGKGENSIWYYSKTYAQEKNNGYPNLRKFIAWSTVSFSGVNCTVAPSSIEIPANAEMKASSNTNTIVVYDRTITATIESACHLTISWHASSVTSYTCTVTPINLNVYFYLNDQTDMYVNDFKIGSEFKKMEAIISCGTQISCSYEKFANNKIKSITFSFKDATGTSQKVKYVTKTQYYIENYNRVYTNSKPINSETVHSETYIKVHDNIDVSVEAKLKTYSVEIN